MHDPLAEALKEKARMELACKVLEEKSDQDFKKFNKIENLVLEALQTDGAHHKQWYLEQILVALGGAKHKESLQRSNQWEEGIAP